MIVVKGGYLVGTKSTRTHPIKNILVKNSNTWNRITVKVHDNIVSIGNIGTNVMIKLVICDNGDSTLVINGKPHYSHKYLFEFEVSVDTDDNDVVQIIDDSIYDG